MRRHKELGEQQQQDMIVNGLHMIRLIFPTLQETLKTCLSRPNDEQAKVLSFLLTHLLWVSAAKPLTSGHLHLPRICLLTEAMGSSIRLYWLYYSLHCSECCIFSIGRMPVL